MRSRSSCRSCSPCWATFSLVPFAVGLRHAGRKSPKCSMRCGAGRKRSIVVSSDLSHYHPYDDVSAHRPRHGRHHPRAVADARSRAGVRRHAGQRLARCARGAAASTPALLDLRNSGDTAGDRSRVVGYASFAFVDHGKRRTDLGVVLAWPRPLRRSERARPRRDRRRPRSRLGHRRARRARRHLCDAAARGDLLRGCIGTRRPAAPAGRGRTRQRRRRGVPRPAVSAARARRIRRYVDRGVAARTAASPCLRERRSARRWPRLQPGDRWRDPALRALRAPRSCRKCGSNCRTRANSSGAEAQGRACRRLLERRGSARALRGREVREGARLSS